MAKDKPDERFEAMRAEKAPTPADAQELAAYVETLVAGDHTYNTCVSAMSLAAVAAYNLVANKLGVTGFQASCADLDILRQTRSLEAGIVLNFNDALYPQYDLHRKLSESLDDAKPWLAEQAATLLAERSDGAHPNVVAHWRKLAAQVPA